MPRQKKNELSTAHWIVKSNALNEIRDSRMTISQMRLLSIYLSKINPLDKESRVVEFRLDEYTRIMQFKQTNITRLKESADELLRINIVYSRDTDDYDEKKRLRGFELISSLLFNRFKLYKNDNGEWLVNIDCHDDVLHLMFDLNKYFFKYRLWNALQLASANQHRMYELLKQYERAGAREISVKDLREFLGLKKNEYKDWADFRKRVLESSQAALAAHTDIKFTWEVSGKRGVGGKINAIKFNIKKNENYEPPFSFDNFITDQQDPVIIEGDAQEFEQTAVSNVISFLSEACDNEFSTAQTTLLHSLIVDVLPYSGNQYQFDMYHYLKRKYNELNWRAEQQQIKNRFAYIKKIIEVDREAQET